MSQGYPEALAEWVKQQEATKLQPDRNVVAFLAVRADTQAAIEAGYSIKTIWAHLHETGKIRFRYETFLRLVRRHRLLETAHPGALGSLPKKKPPPGHSRPASEPGAHTAPTQQGFTFDATPKKEELI